MLVQSSTKLPILVVMLTEVQDLATTSGQMAYPAAFLVKKHLLLVKIRND